MNILNLSPKHVSTLQWTARLLSIVIGVVIVSTFAIIAGPYYVNYAHWTESLTFALPIPFTLIVALIAWKRPAGGGLLIVFVSGFCIYLSLSWILSRVVMLPGFGPSAIQEYYAWRYWDVLIGPSIVLLFCGFMHIVVGWWYRNNKTLST